MTAVRSIAATIPAPRPARPQPRPDHDQRQPDNHPDPWLGRISDRAERADPGPPAMTRRTAFRRSQGGSVAVEMAITLSAALFLILGVGQFGLVFWNWNSMLLAVEEA